MLESSLISVLPGGLDWRMFCAKRGWPMPSDEQILLCSSHVESALFTAQGKGFSIVILPTMGNWLRDGRLVNPIEQMWESELAYYMVCSEGRESEPGIQAFCEWATTLFTEM